MASLCMENSSERDNTTMPIGIPSSSFQNRNGIKYTNSILCKHQRMPVCNCFQKIQTERGGNGFPELKGQ